MRVRDRFLQTWREREILRRVVGSSLWLSADSAFRMAVGFVVGAWVARHLGAARIGVLGEAVAFATPFAALVSVGVNALVVRDLAREPERGSEILGTALAIKLSGALAAALAGVGAAAAFDAQGHMTLMVGVVLAGGFCQAADVVDLWFQARGRASASAWVRSGASLVSSALRVGLIVMDAPLVWFAAASTVELAVSGALLVVMGRRAGIDAGWAFRGSYARALLGEAWPVALAGVAIQVQGQFDQVLLARWRPPEEVGLYVAALRLVSIWAFLPMAVTSASAPEVARAAKNDRLTFLTRMRSLYRVLLLLGGLTTLGLATLAAPLVAVTFGEGFAGAAGLLPWMSVRILLANLGLGRSLFMANQGLTRHSMWTALVGAVVSVGLNVALIPTMGALGCVISSLAAFTVTTLALDVFEPGARAHLATLGSAFGLIRLPATGPRA